MALSRLKKDELYLKLIENGYSNEQLVGLKRPEMIKLLDKNEKEEEQVGQHALSALDDVQIKSNQDDLIEKKNINIEKEISPSHPDWTQYVLSQLLDDEVDGKNPRLDGLRRIAEELIGDIIEEGCDLIQSPNHDNEMTACAKAWVIFNKDGMNFRYEALADANQQNCYDQYGKYLTAMADTRAKGRCYRNALKLRKVIAAEEIDSATVTTSSDNDHENIDTSQLTAIRLLAERLSIPINTILEDLKIDCQKNENNEIILNSLNKGQAKTILRKLNEMNIRRTKEN